MIKPVIHDGIECIYNSRWPSHKSVLGLPYSLEVGALIQRPYIFNLILITHWLLGFSESPEDGAVRQQTDSSYIPMSPLVLKMALYSKPTLHIIQWVHWLLDFPQSPEDGALKQTDSYITNELLILVLSISPVDGATGGTVREHYSDLVN